MTSPPQAAHFEMVGWQLDDQAAAAHLDYRCSRFGPFRETVHFPSITQPLGTMMDETLAGLFDLLLIAAGVSYYKCAAAQEITLPAAAGTPAVMDMAQALYTDGLAEFYIRANLPYPPDIAFKVAKSMDETAANLPAAQPAGARNAALVAFGGGKDSYVARAIAQKAGLDVTLCSVVMSDKVATTLQETAPDQLLFTRRQLDPRLGEVNKAGAYNGHVPITAINSLMLLILAYLNEQDMVIFANERSADEPTIDLNGITANHQYSKSGMFEGKLRSALAAAVPDAPEYFSVLRPFSEIWIGHAFARLKDAFPRFTSCNGNFRITGEKAPRWCGACAKCAFTSLILAPFITRAQAMEIFGESFPDRPQLLPFYRELCGLTDQKPWDCVGTINECRASLWQMHRHEDWKNSLIVQELLPEVLAQTNEEALTAAWQAGLEPQDTHFVPDILMQATHDL